MRTSISSFFLMVIGLGIGTLFLMAPTRVQMGGTEIAKINAAEHLMSKATEEGPNNIPHSVIEHAHALLVVPGFQKKGIFLGSGFGEGLIMVKGDDGSWSNPAFVRVLGGTAELSNVHELDMIFVINATHAVTLLEKGNLVLGKDVTVGKGPTSLESDRYPSKPDIYSYIWNKRNSSIINLNGAILTVYDRSNAYLYKREGLTFKDILEEKGLEPPPAAGRFACRVRAYSNEGTLCG